MSSFQIMPALDVDTEAALRASIEKYGILVLVAVDREGNIIDGHHRLKIANEINEEAVKAGGPDTELYCSSCDKVVAEKDVSDVPRYECGDCGDTFSREEPSDGDSNRCPNCNKFAAKSDDDARYCGECENELDARLAQVFPGEVPLVVYLVDKNDMNYGHPTPAITTAIKAKLKADYPRIRFGRLHGRVVASLDPQEVARSLNLDRRHLTAEQRRELVASLREEGHSLRAIAGAVGVSKSQVEKDVKKVSTGGHLTVVPEVPEKVKGKDGKSYPSSRPVAAKPAAKEARDEAVTQGHSDDVLQATLRQVVPILHHLTIAESFKRSVDEVEIAIDELELTRHQQLAIAKAFRTERTRISRMISMLERDAT